MSKEPKVHTDKKRGLPLSGFSKVLLLVVLIAVIASVSFGAGLWAKYASNINQDTLYVAENFYFESDYLVEPTSGLDSNYTLKEGVDVITVKLRNYTDEFRNSEVDINYTVVLKSVDSTIATKTGTLTKNQQSETELVFDKLAPGMYTVTATSRPYGKTLQATFQVRAAVGELSYSISDSKGSPFLEVVVTSNGYSGKANIILPTGVRPDNTDPLLANTIGNSCTIELPSYSSYTFLFFKDDPSKVYSSSNIIVKKTN